MTRPRLSSLLTHLALAMSGLCLCVAEQPFLPEMQLLFGPYLFLVLLSWRQSGRWMLSNVTANLLGLLAAGAAVGWAALRLHNAEAGAWQQDVPITAAIVPYLGPALLALLLIRLYRPRSLDDFWLLQGLGMAQVALACVLASGTLFGICLLGYLVVILCAMAAHEQQRQARRFAAPEPIIPSLPRGLVALAPFALRWTLAVAAIALPLFLLTPRVDSPEWDPFSRFGVRQQQQRQIRTGFSEEIDLRRSGQLEPDETPAFYVRAVDPAGQPARLPFDQRWRGIVLDRYQEGVWRSEVNWPTGATMYRPSPRLVETMAHDLRLEFRVPNRSGGLFLAEPIWLSAQPGVMPVIASEGSSRQVPLFFEAGGTIVPLTYLTRSEYRYTQLYRYDTGRPRWQALRVKDIYLQRLIHLPATLRRSPVSVFDLETWTRQRLQQVAPPGPLTTALRQTEPGDPLPPEVWAEAATRLADYFAYSGDFAYSLTLRRDNPDLDPVADFLLRVRQGPCERYASSLALALRSLGIPSRLVKGYRGVEGDEEEGTYLVRHSHAHAWVEAYVPAEDDAPQSYDWLVLDPTPGNDPAGTPALLRWLQERQRTGQTLWRDLIFGYNAHQHQEMIQRPAARYLAVAAAAVGGLVVLGAVAWLLRRWWRRRRTGSSHFPPYDRLRALLGTHLRLEPRPDQTPRELADRAAGLLAQQPPTQPLAGVPLQVVEAFYQVRYGGTAPGGTQLQALGSLLDGLEAALSGRAIRP